MIEGDVIDGDTGQGIPGAQVRLTLEDDVPWFTLTDASGHFRFTGLTEKRYSIGARQIGFMRPENGPQSFGGGSSVQPGQAEPIPRKSRVYW